MYHWWWLMAPYHLQSKELGRPGYWEARLLSSCTPTAQMLPVLHLIILSHCFASLYGLYFPFLPPPVSQQKHASQKTAYSFFARTDVTTESFVPENFAFQHDSKLPVLSPVYLHTTRNGSNTKSMAPGQNHQPPQNLFITHTCSSKKCIWVPLQAVQLS